MLNDWVKQILVWLVILLVLLSVFHSLGGGVGASAELPYSNFLREVRNDNVAKVEISADGGSIVGERKDGGAFVTNAPLDLKLIDDLDAHDVEIVQKPKQRENLLVTILINILPVLLFLGVFIYFMRQMQAGGGGRGAMSFGRSRARLQGEDQVKITFADVAGVDEAKDEVKELVEFLRDPGKF
ncbi:MAG: ATP-dependent metalloprotease, partial [Lysobacterales bacterium CG_4_9_14_3_um_filter_62_6]